MDKCITEEWWWYSKASEIITLCSKQTQRHFWSVLSCSKKHYYLLVACQFMLANCGANTHKPVWSAYLLRITNAYRIMHHIPKNVSVRPHQVNHCVKTFDAMLRNNLYRFFKRCASSSNFSFVRFKCLMISTNLHSSSIIQSSCMMETNCRSCWCIVLVFASHQYCFCVAKRKNVCAVYKNQAYKK